MSSKDRTQLSSEDCEIKLQRELGLLDAVGIIVGIMVGSGIFVSPTGVLQFSGSIGLSLLVWLMIGISTLIGAICYTELGTMIPKNGGAFAYLLESFGELPAFLFMWTFVVASGPTGIGIMALILGNYFLQPFFPDCDSPPSVAISVVGATAILFLTWLNCYSIKLSTRFQNVFTFVKMFSLVLIIAIGFYFCAKGHWRNFKNPFEGSKWSLSSISVAFYQGSFSFSGWNCANFIVEELKDPNRDLPRSIWISLTLVVIGYLLTNASYFFLLSPEEILKSSAVASTFTLKAFGGGAWMMSLMVSFITFGGINSSILSVSRIYFSGAREEHLPKCLAYLNKDNFLPVPAIIFTGITTTCMLLSSDVVTLINYLTFVDTFFIFLSIASLLWLRYKRPDMSRPIKVWIGFPIIYLVICTFLIVVPIIERPKELGVAIAIILSGVPVYYLSMSRIVRKYCNKNIGLGQVSKFVQMLTISTAED